MAKTNEQTTPAETTLTVEQHLEIANNRITVLEREASELNESVDKHQKALEVANQELADEKAAHATTKKELEDTIAANEDLSAEVAKLSEQVKNTPAAPVKRISKPTETFEFEGKTYGFRYGKISIKLDGPTPVAITAAEVLASSELQAKLVAMNSGMIKEIE